MKNDGLRFTGVQRYPLESSKSTDGKLHVDRCFRGLVEICLHSLIACNNSGVADLHAKIHTTIVSG